MSVTPEEFEKERKELCEILPDVIFAKIITANTKFRGRKISQFFEELVKLDLVVDILRKVCALEEEK